MVPRLFHQVWLGPNPLPDEYVKYRDTWSQHHPEWEFRLWTEDNLPPSLFREEVRDRLRVPAERADMLRLEVLHEHGGVYIDTDMECLRAIDQLIADLDFFVADSKPGHANNAVIGALPRHPLIGLAIKECKPREFYGYDKAAAGPWLIDRLVKEHPGHKVFEPWVFYPSTPEERSRAYAIHHVARSWKDADGFRRSALLAEKRLQEVQDELWRLMQEIDQAVHVTDPEELRARIARMSAENLNRPLTAVVKSRPNAELREGDTARSVSVLGQLEKKLGQLTRFRRELQRIEKRVSRLDERVDRLHGRTGPVTVAADSPRSNGAAPSTVVEVPAQTAAPTAPAAQIDSKEERRKRKEENRRRKAAAKSANGGGEKPEEGTSGDVTVQRPVKVERVKTKNTGKAKADRKPKREQRRPGIFARVAKLNRAASKHLRKAGKRTQRALGRLRNRRYRSTYATRLDLVKDRDELPIVLNQRGLLGWGAEIGVKTGSYSDLLLNTWKGERLISIDPWLEDAPESYVDRANVAQSRQNEFYEATKRRLSGHGRRSVIWRKTSAEAAKDVENHSLDFVYIDARHDYESVLEDLHLWYDKVRPGGIIAGHDYADGVFDQGVFGVKRAVDEFFGALKLTVYSTEGKHPVEMFASWLVEIPAVPVRRSDASLPWSATESDRREVSAVG